METQRESNNPIFKYICSQFGNPRGIVGDLAGHIMAHRQSNIDRGMWTLELLDIKEHDRVLEVGFGPGVIIAEAAKRASIYEVVGVDHSVRMFRTACRRNARAIEASRIDLRVGSIESLPLGPEERFHKIFSINCFRFWRDKKAGLEHLFEKLSDSGILAITEQPRSMGAKNEQISATGAQIADLMRETGFRSIQIHEKEMSPVNCVCVVGVREITALSPGSNSLS